MALRSGYYGLKGSVKKVLEELAGNVSGMKIIKSFGDGLSLSNAGKLNLQAATSDKIGGIKVGSGLAIDNGVLSVSGGSGAPTVLHDGATPITTAGTIELSDDITNYKILAVEINYSTTDSTWFFVPVTQFLSRYPNAGSFTWMVSPITLSNVASFARFKAGADNTHIANELPSACSIGAILGI